MTKLTRVLVCTFSSAVLTCLLLTSGTSFAQVPQSMTATAFAAFPANAVLEVRAGRDLPLERDLVAEASKLLVARGFTVAPRGDIIVTVDSTTPLPGIASRNAFTNEDRLRSMDTRRNDGGVQVLFNKSDEEPGAAVFALRMSAYRPGESNLWVGQASGPDAGSGRRGTTFALAESLISVFGQSFPAVAEE
jgi:hypothetical protein